MIRITREMDPRPCVCGHPATAHMDVRACKKYPCLVCACPEFWGHGTIPVQQDETEVEKETK